MRSKNYERVPMHMPMCRYSRAIISNITNTLRTRIPRMCMDHLPLRIPRRSVRPVARQTFTTTIGISPLYGNPTIKS
ncbi:26S proteasome non-ATPase regulatory subunit 10 [Histoplasma ohiense]|nr:26S proteasome non-ATPase regulatory subunit 10 [Histoplasma ohiense (nom. inval.)]